MLGTDLVFTCPACCEEVTVHTRMEIERGPDGTMELHLFPECEHDCPGPRDEDEVPA